MSDQYDRQMPEETKEYWLFREKFGGMGIEEATGDFVYATDDEEYTIPESATKESLTNLIHKSLADNHDYLLDYVKKYGKEIVYEPDIDY